MKLLPSSSARAPVKFKIPTADNLVPIRLDIEIDGQRFKDAFTWNPADPDSEVVVFAKRTLTDFRSIGAERGGEGGSHQRREVPDRAEASDVEPKVEIIPDSSGPPSLRPTAPTRPSKFASTDRASYVNRAFFLVTASLVKLHWCRIASAEDHTGLSLSSPKAPMLCPCTIAPSRLSPMATSSPTDLQLHLHPSISGDNPLLLCFQTSVPVHPRPSQPSSNFW